MFYSHELLTDRRHGVATIWLVATLGSRSALKKITRKAIMDVDVPEACDTITDPSAPMALRLQGNLLIGVSRVFSQQCGFVLGDIQSLKEKMRGMTMLLKEVETDPSVAATRPEQLNLYIDTQLDMDLDLGFSISSFGTRASSPELANSMSPKTLAASSQTSMEYEDEHLLGIPSALSEASSDGPGPSVLDVGKFDMPDWDHGPLADRPERVLNFEEPAIYADDGFHMAEDGSLVYDETYNQDLLPLQLDESVVRSNEEVNDFQLELGDARDMPADTLLLPQTHNSPEAEAEDGGDAHSASASNQEQSEHGEGVHRGTEQSSASQSSANDSDQQELQTVAATAPLRTARTKIVPVDVPAELPTQVLGQWDDRYVVTMKNAQMQKATNISVSQAKQNAAYWILDQGIGGTDISFHADRHVHPLSAFSGQELLGALLGPDSDNFSSARKRNRSATAEDDDNSRRVRSRSSEIMIDDTIEDHAVGNEDEEMILAGGDEDIEPEVGRHQVPPMSEQSESMPWNVYASSRQGSRFGSARPGFSAVPRSSSAGIRAGFDVHLPSNVGFGPGPRLVSESPLEARQRMLRASSHESDPQLIAGSAHVTNRAGILPPDVNDVSDSELDRQLAGYHNQDTDFELVEPETGVDSQGAGGSSQWLAATFEQEVLNFLAFIQSAIESKRAAVVEEQSDAKSSVTFRELLPSTDNNEVVAAQGFLHVLSLATKGLIAVKQEVDFGEIELTIPNDAIGGTDDLVEEGMELHWSDA